MADSSFGQIVGVLTSPEKTFEGLREKPRWVVAVMVLVLLGATVNWLVSERIDAEEFVRASIEQRGQDVTEEQIQVGIDIQEKFGKLLMVGGALVAGPLAYVALALVCWVAFKLVGGEWSFEQSFSTLVHSFMPWAVAYALTLPVILGQSEISFEQVQSGSLLPSSLAFLAGDDSSSVIKALWGSIDLFSIWTVVLLAIGASVMARIRLKTAATTTMALWVVWILVKVGWVAIWS